MKFYCQCAVILLCHILASIATVEVTINYVPVTVVGYSTVSPVDAWNAVDEDMGTAWDLPTGQTTANFTGEFDHPYTIYNFTLTLGGASAVPTSSRVILYGDDATWTVYINKTCSDNFYHWTSENELTNCVTASRSTEVTSPLGVFWVINSSDGSLVWRLNFTRVEMFIDGRNDDFKPGYHAFYVSELLLRAFSSGGDTPECNCDLTGVASSTHPCNTLGTCQCRCDSNCSFYTVFNFNSACVGYDLMTD